METPRPAGKSQEEYWEEMQKPTGKSQEELWEDLRENLHREVDKRLVSRKPFGNGFEEWAVAITCDRGTVAQKIAEYVEKSNVKIVTAYKGDPYTPGHVIFGHCEVLPSDIKDVTVIGHVQLNYIYVQR